jgi:putative addiction module killer protein
LADRKARGVIRDRILQIEGGLIGKTKSLGDKVAEIKIDFGPGYRLYYSKVGLVVIILLCGGDKSSQRRDIKRAKKMAGEL